MVAIFPCPRLVLELARVKARPKDSFDVILVYAKLAVVIDPGVLDAPVSRRLGQRRFDGARLGIEPLLVCLPPIRAVCLFIITHHI